MAKELNADHEYLLSHKCIDEWVESSPSLPRDPKRLLEMTIPSSQIHAKLHFNSEWRRCTTIEQFAALTGLDPAGTRVLHLVTAPYLVRNQCTLSTAIIKATQSWIKAFTNNLSFEDTHWIELERFSENNHDDQIASLVPLLVKIGVSHSTRKTAEYIACIRQVFPRRVITSGSEDRNTLIRQLEGFFNDEPFGQRDIIMPAFSKICEYYQLYRCGTGRRYVSPCMHILGASGLGKSFTVGQFAQQGYTYVVYYNFLDTWMDSCYPKRSVVADFLEDTALDDLTLHIECLVAVGLMQVKLCRQLGISPRGFFNLQVRPKFFHLYQHWVADFVQEVFEEYRQFRKHGPPPQNGQSASTSESSGVTAIRRILQSRVGKMTTLMSLMRERLQATDLDPSYLTDPQPDVVLGEGELEALICFDNVRGLVAPRMKGNGSWWGKAPGPDDSDVRSAALEAALQNMSRPDGAKSGSHFFGILIDRAPLEPLGHRHFKPIIITETFGLIHHEATAAISPDRLQEVGYRHINDSDFERPPWTASTCRGYTTAGYSPSSCFIGNLARVRCFDWHDFCMRNVARKLPPTMDIAGLLALVSWRVDFDVLLPSLADDLCCRFGRLVIDIDDQTGFVQTMQPSEPVLVAESFECTTFNTGLRVKIVEALYASMTGGAIRTDNIGRLVAALILLLTRDSLVLAFAGEGSPMNFGRFLRGLFPGVIDEIGEAGAIILEGSQPVERILEEGQVIFDHCVQVLEMPDDSTLRNAYYRQAIIIPTHACSDIDLIIPVYLPSTDEMTYFIIQVDNTPNSQMTPQLCEDARNGLKAAAAQLPRRSAHVAMRMALRMPRKSRATVRMVYPKKEIVKKWFFLEREVGDEVRWDDGNDRLVLVAVGLDPYLYRSLLHSDNRYGWRGPNSEEAAMRSCEMIACLGKLLDCRVAAPVVDTQQPKEQIKHLYLLG